MRNYESEGQTIEMIAPSGGVTSGVPVVIGDMFVIPLSSATVGVSFIGYVKGVYTLTKATGFAPAAGAAAYYDAADGLMYGAFATGRHLVGVFNAAALTGATTCSVRLDGVGLKAATELVTAAAVTVADTGNLFTGTDVEACLAEAKTIVDADHTALAELAPRIAHQLAPILAQWDPSDIGGGPVDPPTSVEGDRYMAVASAGDYTVWRIYTYTDAEWVETIPANGDACYDLDADLPRTFNGAMWDTSPLLAHTHGGTSQGSKLLQANTHETPDTDSATTALHHTLGSGANQAAAGNHTHPASPAAPGTSTSVTTATIRGAAVVTRVGASTGTAAISGDSKRTGDLTIEITVNGEADGGVAKFKWYFGSEVASADIDVTTAGIAIGAGVTVAFTNGGPLSFETGDKFVFPVSWETSLSGFDCGLITVPAMNTPGTPITSETVLVHWDATRIASAAAPVTISMHTSAAGMLAIDAKATAEAEAKFTILNWSGGDWTDETGTVTLCRP